ncbi:flagellar biosynthesis protein FlhF [Litchfieldia salsa]|uniref:Flagellar biosynthesis protein FlhF n=1 Tax=Litchfieldia salsa TaxID=930152 RepID=A0A1H0R7K6_9BACI|nr:flagellar biosynthesis protein FlhF [Litchfieldia salsa]SDP24958.1 flagellar biosynthesis protein FlhF [Litchfieldia salsa]
MKVKKYEAASMPEAMKMIRAELGNEAVILNSKIVHKNGFLGFFRKKNIEVIAAIDTDIQKTKKQEPLTKHNIHQKQKNQELLKNHNVQQGSLGFVEQAPMNSPKPSADILNQISELKSIITSMQKDTLHVQEHYPLPIQELSSFLVEEELNASIRNELISSLLVKWYENKEELNGDDLKQYLREILIDKLKHLSFGAITYQKKYISVAGPTGVGKTTTLAKIAAESILKDGKKVAFITTDTYRIAAIDQLKTYAKILNVPIEVSYNIDDFKKAKEKFREYDLVLIDTAGRNFRNQQYVDDLKQIIDFNEELETYLVLGLTSKYSDMITIYKQFSLLNIIKVIFTKADETSHYGQMINFMLMNNIGAAYITTGQNVPDDIHTATPELVVETLFGEDLND